jgi:hypothetical protein
MPQLVDLDQVALFLPTLILLLKNVVDSMQSSGAEDVGEDAKIIPNVFNVHRVLVDMNTIVSSVLYDFRVAHDSSLLDPDVGWWVKPRSTTWFSRFFLFEYDDSRWIENFRMSKSSLLNLSRMLAPHIQRQNTRFRKAVPSVVKVACALYKLTQGASLLSCSEQFAIGKSTMSCAIRDVVRAVNVVLRREIQWPRGNAVQTAMDDFREWCGLPAVVGAIDGTHFDIHKPHHSPEDYYYFKTGGYSMQCQAVVDKRKRFLDVYVGMPGSTNDCRMLKRSSLYNLARHGRLFDANVTHEGFNPYLLGDKGYPLLPWLLTPGTTV